MLRLGPVNRHRLLPYEMHLMEAEAELLELEDCYILREEYNLPQESQNTAARVLAELAQLEAVSED